MKSPAVYKRENEILAPREPAPRGWRDRNKAYLEQRDKSANTASIDHYSQAFPFLALTFRTFGDYCADSITPINFNNECSPARFEGFQEPTVNDIYYSVNDVYFVLGKDFLNKLKKQLLR